jgi:subtilisin family serine protease
MFVGAQFDSLGLCPACPLLAIAAVDESFLQSRTNPLDVARRIVLGLLEAIRRNARIIQISLEFGFGSSSAARLIANAIHACVSRGAAVVLASGGGHLRLPNNLLWLPGVVPVCAADEAGEILCDERWGAMMALKGLAAPGTRIPGALLPDGTGLRSGSSYAASFVTATLALLMSVVPGLLPLEAASVLRHQRSIAISVGHPVYLDADHSLNRLRLMKGVLHD